jgi:hypothetical protein
MRVNAINLKWDDVKGEGVVKTLSYFDTAHYVTKLDLLQDCIYDLQNLYDEIILADKNILQRPVKTFSGGEPNYVTMPETSREDIIRMAREAGLWQSWLERLEESTKTIASLEKFAAFVAAHEREKCVAIVLDNSDAEGICCTDDVLEAFRQREEK